MSEPKVVSLTGAELDAVRTALNNRRAILIHMTAKMNDCPMTEIELRDHVT